MALVSPRDGVSGGPSWGCLLALLSLLCATRETLVVARTAGRALAQTAVLPYELVNRNPEVFPFEYYTITDNDLRYAAGRSGDPEIIYRVTYVFGGSWLLLGGTPLVGGSVFKQVSGHWDAL